MTEEIIIDGVNVSGCCCYENGKCLWTKRYYENNIAPDCEKVKNCYYKQLKRLEQLKNKYYQQTLDDEIQINNLLEEIQQIKQDRNVENITRLSLENSRLEQENKELRQRLSEIGKNWGEIEELRKQVESQKGLITVGSKQQYEMTMAYDKFKTALEEISSLIDKIHYRPVAKMKEIQELIKKVLNP